MVSSLKVGYETLVSDSSGRNANGDTVLDVINRKRKIYVTLRHTFATEMRAFLASIKNYQITITYLDPETNSTQTANVYISTPEPEFYLVNTTNPNMSIYKPLSLNFIEL
jgi:hypothetical protein